VEIQKLSDDVIDQIAAGEVVDRPAHMVKELLENSLDAGATDIEVAISEGGRQVEITDNGKGVAPEDLALVFDRHATSKITVSNDLWNLHSFGFRGEALATISSVSEMTFASRRQGQNQGYQLQSVYGKLGSQSPVSMAEGSKVTIQGLFENTPARKKFLKSDSAENTQIKNVLKAVAMSHPKVSFKVKINGKLTFLWESADDFKSRVEMVLDQHKLYSASHDYEGIHVEAVFSDPGTTARVSRQMWFFVQDRWVQDRTLQAAVMEAYRSLLMHGEYPYCAIRILAPPDQVDVNIHPTKSQVKFLKTKDAFRSVHYCLRDSLEKAPWLEGVVPAARPKAYFESPAIEPENTSFKESTFQNVQYQKKSFEPRSGPSFSGGLEVMKEEAATRADLSTPVSVMDSGAASSPMTSPTMTSEATAAGGPWSRLQVIGQVDLTYIVTQSENQMVLIDQHAAHERVAFERLMRDWKAGKMETQGFLLPLTVDFEEAEMEGLLEHLPEIEKMGISLEQAGPTTMSIGEVPAMIKETGVVRALKKLAADCLDKGGSFALETAIGDIFATMACHSVVRAGQSLSVPEMEQLLKDMDEFPLSGFCPHGRSVSVEKDFVQLEKDFGRRA